MVCILNWDMVVQSTMAEHFSYVDLVNFGSIAKDSKYSDWAVSVVSSDRKKHTQEHGNVRSPVFFMRNKSKV
jgi:hypothetical protein